MSFSLQKSLLTVCLLLTLFACSKEEDENSPAQKLERHFPLTVGNTWIYENFRVDTLGNEKRLKFIDTVTISDEIILNGKTHFVFTGNHYPYHPSKGVLRVVKDSSGYIVDTSGRIIFSSIDFSDSLRLFIDSIGYGGNLHTDVYRMMKAPSPVSVPAGVFNDVLIYHGLHYTERPYPGVPNPKSFDSFYARGVGLVKNTEIMGSQSENYERRLIAYFIIE